MMQPYLPLAVALPDSVTCYKGHHQKTQHNLTFYFEWPPDTLYYKVITILLLIHHLPIYKPNIKLTTVF